MCCNDGYIHLHKCRCHHGSQNDVQSCCRHTHTHDYRGYHCKEKSRVHLSVGKCNYKICKFQTQACQSNYTNYYPGHCTCSYNTQRISRTLVKSIQKSSGREPRVLSQKTGYNYYENSCIRSFYGRISRYEHINNAERCEEKECSLFHNLKKLWQLFFGYSLETHFGCFRVNHKENRNIIKNGRNSRMNDQLSIGDTGHFSHDKGSCTHYRRHYLPTRGGCRFNTASKLRFISYALHEWNGKCTRSCNICKRTPGYRSHYSACNYCCLGRTTSVFARKGKSKINKGLSPASLSEKGPQKNKHENKRSCYIYRNSINTLTGQEKMLDYSCQTKLAMAKIPWYKVPKNSI